jgi:hypothetical protein
MRVQRLQLTHWFSAHAESTTQFASFFSRRASLGQLESEVQRQRRRGASGSANTHSTQTLRDAGLSLQPGPNPVTQQLRSVAAGSTDSNSEKAEWFQVLVNAPIHLLCWVGVELACCPPEVYSLARWCICAPDAKSYTVSRHQLCDMGRYA